MMPSLYMKRCPIAGFLLLIFVAFLYFNEALPYFGASPRCSAVQWPTITDNFSYHLPVILNKVYSNIFAVWHHNCETPQCAATPCQIYCRQCYAIEAYPGPMTLYAEFIPAQWFNPSWLIYHFNESLTLRGRFYTYFMFTKVRPPATVKVVLRLAGLTVKRPLIAFIEAGRPYPWNCWGELVSKVKETFYLRETARVRVRMRDIYGNVIDGKTAPKRNYAELFSAKILRSPEDKEPMYYESFKMSCPGACDGWLVIEWTPKAYQGGQYIWIGVKQVRPDPPDGTYVGETAGDPIPIRETPIFFSVVPGGTPFFGASPRCSTVQWPATGREGMIPYLKMMVGLRYRVQVSAKFFACESSECSGKICSATCPPCQIYKGYPGTFALRGEYKTDKPAQKFGSAWIPSNFSESPQSRGLYLIDFSLSRDVKPPATLKIFTLIGGGENINYMIAKVQAGPPDPARTWGEWASEGKERVDLKSTAKFRVMMTDSYGNVINAVTAPDREYSQIFSVKILRNPSDSQPMYAENFKMSCNGQCNGPVCANSCDGWLTIEWTPMTHVGRQWLWIGVQIPPPSPMLYPNLFALTLRAPRPIQGSPFMYTVLPATDVSRCVGDWRKDHLKAPNSFEVGKEIIFDISKKNSDNKFQSTWIYPFTIKILDADTKQPLNVGMKASQASELEVVQSVQFTLQRAGNFLLQVSGRQVPGRWTEFIIGSPFPFRMLPGPIDVGSCFVSLKGHNEIIAGEKVVFELTLKDSYGNNISLNTVTNQTLVNDLKLKLVQPEKLFKVPISLDPMFVPISDLGRGVITLEGYPKVAGNVSFEASMNGRSILGTPHPLIVRSGPASVSTCSCNWKYNDSSFEAGTSADIEVLYVDKYYNAVNSSFIFQPSFLSYRAVYMAPLAVDLSKGQLVPEFITLTFSPTKAGLFFIQIGTKNQNITNSPLDYMVSSGPVSTQACIPQWQNVNLPVQAGKNATLRVWLMDSFGNNVSRHTFSREDPAIFAVHVMSVGSFGNTSTINSFELVSKLNMADGYQEFYLSIKKVGQYKIYVNDKNTSISGSPASLEVIPGNVAIYNCVAFWGNGKIIFRTGDMAIIHVLLKDDYNNSLSPISSMVNFSVMAARRNGVSDVFSECHLDFTVQDAVNYKLITFWTNTTGIFRLQVGTQKMNISNSPLTFTVLPGAFDIKKSSGKWLGGVDTFDVGGEASLVLNPVDSGRNFVSLKLEDLQTLGNSITVIRNSTGSQVSLSGLYLNPPVGDSVRQILSFSVEEPGTFLLSVRNGDDSLLGSPFLFRYTQGDFDTNKSDIFGNGLQDSIAGNVSIFFIQLRDSKSYPTGSIDYSPQVSISRLPNYEEVNKSVISYRDRVGFYKVTYSAEISGTYVIVCTWKGIMINRGGAIKKTVHAGPFYLPHTQVSGSGLEGGMACSWLTLTILTFDYYNNSYQGKVNVTLVGAVGSNMDYNVSIGVGQTNVSYIIRQSQSDPYIISMSTNYNDEEAYIPPSPFQVRIFPGIRGIHMKALVMCEMYLCYFIIIL